jgi:4-hydroxybenzoate polyprenyltransferase
MIKALLQSLRPAQWTKNLVVMAAFFFALGDRNQNLRLGWNEGGIALLATLLFCLVSSGIYIFNDIVDRDRDRHHPEKKNRPIAAGRIPLSLAYFLVLGLLSIGLAGALLLQPGFGGIIAAYIGLQILYSLALKKIALVDTLVIAAGFVLRAMGGAIALAVTISPWLLLCAFLLALFLGLCKRRSELILLDEHADAHRPSLSQYDRPLLDQLIAIVSASVIVTYSVYTLWPETVAKFGTHGLALTIPFTLFGIFRYLDLVYRHQKGGKPEWVLLGDIPLICDIVLYTATLMAIFKFGR